jgi:hypothetical protein
MLLSGLSRTNGQSVSVSASRRRSLYTLVQPVSHLMRRERSRTLLLGTLPRSLERDKRELNLIANYLHMYGRLRYSRVMCAMFSRQIPDIRR